jgi:TonB dependent receptor
VGSVDEHGVKHLPRQFTRRIRSVARYDLATRSHNAAGNSLDAAPRSSFTLGAGYDRPFTWGDLSARAEYYRQDKIYFDPTNVLAQSQAAHGLVKLNVGYTSLDEMGCQADR